jgi:eukaryotic-like serine/threonine-protein kinase
VRPDEQLVEKLAAAILDGSPVDWAAVESSSETTARPLVRQLRVLAAVAELHRPDPLSPASVVRPQPARPDPLPACHPVQWGHLQLRERIGRGGFGEVYRAWETRLDREVALKLLPVLQVPGDRSASTIIEEGRLLARVRHPNVVTIYGAEQIAGRIGLWMEYVRGQTLEQILEERRIVSPTQALSIGLELCRAVSAVHRAGLLHRDIKTHNVMRADDGRILLMDFGTGRDLEDDAASDLAGTPLYLAPEVLEGHPATVRSDIYSLGVVLYRLVTGSYPVLARTVHGVRRAHARGDRIAVQAARRDVPAKLARVVERASHPRPEGRYASADALYADLAGLTPQARMTRLAHAVGIAAACMLILGVSWELAGRFVEPSRTPSALVAGLVTASPSPLEQPIIAVLPFENLGSGTDGDLLVDSLTAGLIRQLGVIDGLQVRSVESSFRVRDGQHDLADVARRLRVNLVVQGTARVSDGRLRIDAALVSVAGGATLWSRPVDVELRAERDLAGLIEALTRMIVNELRLKLAPTQRRYETDVATLRTYLKARALRDARGSGALESITLFEEVIRVDPAFAPAKAALASVYGFLASQYPGVEGNTIPPEEAAARMDPLIRSALDIDPILAEAHAANGHLHAMGLRWAQADASFRRAIALEPTLTSLYGDFAVSTLLPSGRVDEALAVLEAALEADPLSLDLRRVLSYVQLSAGLYREARDTARDVLAVDPTLPYVENHLRWALLFNGERAEALELFERHSVGRPGVRGYIHAINGRRAEAESIAAQFDHFPHRQAEIFGLLGDEDRALEALERLAALNPARAAAFLNHPELGLRGDPRAEAFRRRLRSRQ